MNFTDDSTVMEDRVERRDDASMRTERHHIPYRPRPLQAALHEALARFNVIVAHRRFGKTVWAVNAGIRHALTCHLERPRVAYLCPLLKQAKQVAWDYAKHYTQNIPGISVNESELRIDFPNGARFQLLGADNPDSLRGIYLDLAIMDEYAQMSPRVWTEVVRPALADRRGSAIFIGTPYGRNHYYDLYRFALKSSDWKTWVLPVSKTRVVPQEELEAAAALMAPEEYEQEFECSWFAAVKGAYYATEMSRMRSQGRITVVPWEPDCSVYTMWDLGINDQLAIWWYQLVGREHRFIRVREWTDTSLADVAREVMAEPYTYEEHILPHDASHREMWTGKSRASQMEGIGLRPITIAPKTPVADGIATVRQWLNVAYMDEKECDIGITALESYQKQWDDQKGVYRDQPLHNWASHSADAIRAGAVVLQGPQSLNENLPRVLTAIQNRQPTGFFGRSRVRRAIH